jgi:hypothetical protein
MNHRNYRHSRHGRPLPRFIRDLLASPPQRGGGLHQWIFRVACSLHKYRKPDEIITLLENATAGENVKPREIEDAVYNSASPEWQVPKRRKDPPPWPPVNHRKRAEIIASGAGLSDLWEISPRPHSGVELLTEEIIDALFPGDPLLCCGRSNDRFKTRRRSEWRSKLSALQFIVPSPMTSVWGTTKDGRKSQHTLSNTGPRRFLVIEQDSGTPDEQAAVLVYLARRAPLVLAVHSGGKSIHGWFYCEGVPENRLHSFMRYAVSLGADRATWTRSQFVRMPDGTRDNGNHQSVYFFNPEVLK